MKTLIGLCLSLVTVTAYAAPELKGHPDELKQFIYPNKRTVTINDEAKEKAYSDKAIISLVVTTEEDLLADAITKNSELRSLIAKTLIEQSVKAKDINNAKFSSSPQYGWFGDDPDSFEIVNRMAINIYDEKQMKAVATLADKYKEVTLASTTFEHSKEDEFKKKVKQKVLAKVMEQKKVYEQTLGIKLKAVSFHTPRFYKAATHGARELENKIVITGSRIKAKKSRDQVSESLVSQAPSNSFDEVEYRAEIAVVFEVVENNNN